MAALAPAVGCGVGLEVTAAAEVEAEAEAVEAEAEEAEAEAEAVVMIRRYGQANSQRSLKIPCAIFTGFLNSLQYEQTGGETGVALSCCAGNADRMHSRCLSSRNHAPPLVLGVSAQTANCQNASKSGHS